MREPPPPLDPRAHYSLKREEDPAVDERPSERSREDKEADKKGRRRKAEDDTAMDCEEDELRREDDKPEVEEITMTKKGMQEDKYKRCYASFEEQRIRGPILISENTELLSCVNTLLTLVFPNKMELSKCTMINSASIAFDHKGNVPQLHFQYLNLKTMAVTHSVGPEMQNTEQTTFVPFLDAYRMLRLQGATEEDIKESLISKTPKVFLSKETQESYLNAYRKCIALLLLPIVSPTYLSIDAKLIQMLYFSLRKHVLEASKTKHTINSLLCLNFKALPTQVADHKGVFTAYHALRFDKFHFVPDSSAFFQGKSETLKHLPLEFSPTKERLDQEPHVRLKRLLIKDLLHVLPTKDYIPKTFSAPETAPEPTSSTGPEPTEHPSSLPSPHSAATPEGPIVAAQADSVEYAVPLP